MGRKSVNSKKLCLVCSSGGHFMYLNALKEYWKDFPRFWVTFHAPSEKLLENEKVYWAFSPTNRSIINLMRNFFLAINILCNEKPTLLITTGAGVSVPFVFVAKILGIKSVYIESLNRTEDISLSGKLVYPIADYFLVRWPGLMKKYKRARFEGLGI